MSADRADDPTVPAPAAPTDGGRLDPEARRALVALLRQGVVVARHKRLLYDALVRHAAAIRAHLADMYLTLLLDEREGVAVLLQQPGEPEDAVDGDEPDVTALVTRRTLSLHDTLVLLVLRKHYQDRQTAGDQLVHIDLEHIEAGLAPFLPLTTSTRSDQRRLSGTLERLLERRVLARVRGDDSRFEVTPVIRYVVDAEALEGLLGAYRALLESGRVPGGEADDD
ncbi:MAG: DUF4194 domain-containing protein [Ectothiorhodospiraceae bacterium]|nr:DUF4194 domain-containing protein [Chromatiales bacterium]MCP5157371.1 DUF4194 domain-containing protein [Ectothiorhodospiraceae bacterium]